MVVNENKALLFIFSKEINKYMNKNITNANKLCFGDQKGFKLLAVNFANSIYLN